MANPVKDVVCGMDVDPDTASWKSDYEGKTYYFCSPGCKRAFDVDPQAYLNPQGHTSADHTHNQ